MKTKQTTKEMIQSLIEQKKNQLIANQYALSDIDNQIRIINYSNTTIEADIMSLQLIIEGKDSTKPVETKRKYVKKAKVEKKRKTVLSPETKAYRQAAMREVAAIMKEGFSRQNAWKQMKIRRANLEVKAPETAQEIVNTSEELKQ